MSNTATIIWLDPGMTTGIAILSISTAWLEGDGSAEWAALRNAVKYKWWAQVGDKQRTLDDFDIEWPTVRLHDDVEQRQRGYNPAGDLDAVLEGKGHYRGGVPTRMMSNLSRQAIQIRTILEQYPEAAWGHEDFILRTRNASRETLSPVALNSMVTSLELLMGARARWPFVQSAQMAMTTATDARLKDAHLYVPGMPHATDASRHAATFLRNARAHSSIRKAAWPELFDSKWSAK